MRSKVPPSAARQRRSSEQWGIATDDFTGFAGAANAALPTYNAAKPEMHLLCASELMPHGIMLYRLIHAQEFVPAAHTTKAYCPLGGSPTARRRGGIDTGNEQPARVVGIDVPGEAPSLLASPSEKHLEIIAISVCVLRRHVLVTDANAEYTAVGTSDLLTAAGAR
mmetsp:Transcript_81461/g.181308  ORF Transcript_81461/g.181308 Transcript_81461/m.181308 type:complete len:166 (+) Transcript_81461:2364-2861(+)